MDNSQNIDLNHLLIFNKIAESQSLTVAAKLLKQDKARLSRILASLEKAIGTTLIYRTTRQFRLTEAGKQLYRNSAPALLSLRQTTHELLRTDGELQGHIRLTGAHGVFARLVAPIIAEFTKAYPKITFELIFAQQSLDLVKEGIDLAIRMGQPKDSSLTMQKIGDFFSVFVASSSYVKTLRRPSFGDFDQYRMLMLEALNNKPLAFVSDDQQRTINIKSFLTCNGPDVLLDLTLNGSGISLLPEVLVRDHIKSGALIHLFPDWRTTPTPMNLLHSGKKKSLPVHIQLFSEYMTEKLRKQIST